MYKGQHMRFRSQSKKRTDVRVVTKSSILVHPKPVIILIYVYICLLEPELSPAAHGTETPKSGLRCWGLDKKSTTEGLQIPSSPFPRSRYSSPYHVILKI
ncbi:developmentally-regulated GTP-binding protein 1 [Platysternon megacephalum]|uniref:Developmentally-regulated GTP-binding protein 1 n=1 Tax=Platysternon megacephalum TaxID=55544 RepID=A0A4D9E692_9SAUR|nr:developmentally-regulated GTP-binding protein 1 [Platysternon megacephalum]